MTKLRAELLSLSSLDDMTQRSLALVVEQLSRVQNQYTSALEHE